jgi:N-methylhydantoinase A/oxoprolinase/acetone carboxylase beta subunit
MRYGIGIDTGGTYTDSVIIDFVAHHILSKSKALTTRQDLRVGIMNSLSGLDASLFPEVRLAALSTTLATNSIVEGKGQRVGLIIAAPNKATFRVPPNIPAEEVAVINGAFNRSGQETVALDIDGGQEAILRLKDSVDAFAVSGYFSIYNPEHELKLKEFITRESNSPVVCGHELTGAVGMVERAITAAFNARLLPVVGDLLDSVVDMLKQKGIEAPLMVVCGDGSLISEKAARNRPVETILSGPAASMIGASWLTGLNDAMIADMGGTTTDIGILSGSMPRISENGAIIGGWQTRIRSIEIWTVGLGGDSQISISAEGAIRIGPRRAEPLSHACSKYPELERKIEQLRNTEETQRRELDLNYFVLVKRPNFKVEKQEQHVLDALEGSPLHLTEIEQLAGPWFDVRRFVNLGAVAEISFTPTDLLHCMRALSLWDANVCESAVAFYAEKTGMSRETLLHKLFNEIAQKLKQTLVSIALAYEEIPIRSQESSELLASILRLGGNSSISAKFQLEKPLIAVGAPVSAYFPAVAEQLGARLVIPENADVANAAGAVTGRVIASAQVFIRPVRPMGFIVVPGDEAKVFDHLGEATAFAEQQARQLAHTRAQENGASKIDVTINTEEVAAPLAGGCGKTLLMELRVNAVAIGEPCLQKESAE